MGFKSWHTPFWLEGFLLNEQTWLQHLKEKRLAYGLSQNRLAVATGITRQYLSDIETGKVKPSEDLQHFKGSSGTLQSRRSPWNAVWLCKDSLSDNRRTAGGRKHLTTETVLFSSWGLWFLFLFRTLCLRRYIRSLLSWDRQRCSGGIKRSWVQTIWKLSSSTTKKLVWVLYGRFGGWWRDETPWPCHQR